MVPSCRCSQQNPHHGGAETLAECSDDRQHAGGIAGMFPRDVSEHFPIIGTLEAAKPHPADRATQADIQAEGLSGNVASRTSPPTKTISPRVEMSGAEIVSAQRPACGAISTMPIGHGVNSSADTTGL